MGCGTGEHALLAAGLGLDAWGVDTSPAAIGIAGRKAAERGLSARFTVHDAFDLPGLGERFDTVLDSGLFHVFSDEDRRGTPGASATWSRPAAGISCCAPATRSRQGSGRAG